MLVRFDGEANHDSVEKGRVIHSGIPVTEIVANIKLQLKGTSYL